MATEGATGTTPAETPADWRRVHAFGLPDGSVRAILAVALFATIWTLLLWRPTRPVPDYVRNLLFIIMGHYFATRRRDPERPSIGPGPLYLPRGTIRWILFGGFIAVAIILVQRGHFRDPIANPGALTLLLVAGFLLGVVVARFNEWRFNRGHVPPRWVEDARAILALAAAAVLIFLVLSRLSGVGDPDSAPLAIGNLRLAPYTLEHVLSAVVGFYFGSRS